MMAITAVISCDRNKRFSASAGGNPKSANTFPSADVTCVVPSELRSRTTHGLAVEPPPRRFAGFPVRPALLGVLMAPLTP